MMFWNAWLKQRSWGGAKDIISQKDAQLQQKDKALQLSQLLEEKTLSVQLSDTSQSLRESQQYSSDLFKHCAVLEKQVQELQAVFSALIVLQLHFYVGLVFPLSEAQQQLGSTKQEGSELKKLLEEERDQRSPRSRVPVELQKPMLSRTVAHRG
ncbi:hypothetical protein U0070_017078 [Myodes glareolus]|uniref:Uncharacterized protein n=1 Tax=Myodes glareolus TaxID=447135 RepID=A0AAW0JJ26_MYOGA